MKKPALAVVPVLFLFTVALIFIGVLNNSNNDLRAQVAERDALIKKSQASDSLNCEHTEKYVNTVTKYITNDCSLVVDGKKVSLDNFITIYAANQTKLADLSNKLYVAERQYNLLKIESLKRQIADVYKEDSLADYRQQLKSLKKYYGLTTRTKRSGKYRITEYESKKLDSALVLLGVYRKRLSYDSLAHRWTIRGQ